MLMVCEDLCHEMREKDVAGYGLWAIQLDRELSSIPGHANRASLLAVSPGRH